MLPLPALFLILRHQVPVGVLLAWMAVGVAETIRANFFIRRMIVRLARDGAGAGWVRRTVPGWLCTGLVLAALPFIARAVGTTDAMFIAIAIAVATSATTVVVAQGFTLLALASAGPLMASTIGCLIAGTPGQRVLGLLGLGYLGTLSRIHREVAQASTVVARLQATTSA